MRVVLSNPKKVEEMEDIARLGGWLPDHIPESMGNFPWIPWVLLYRPIRNYEASYASLTDFLQLFSKLFSLKSSLSFY